MTSKVKNISKMMIIYQLMYMTDDATRAIRDAIKTLKISFRKILTNEEDVYREAEKYQIELYDKAWNICFEAGVGQVIEFSSIIDIIYESIDPKISNKLIGKKKINKAITSYFLSTEDDSDDVYAIESRSRKFAEQILELYDGKKEMSALARRIYTMKQNAILEGKDPDKYKEELNGK